MAYSTGFLYLMLDVPSRVSFNNSYSIFSFRRFAGNGTIEQKVDKNSEYYIAVGNLNPNSMEVISKYKFYFLFILACILFSKPKTLELYQ